MCAPMRLRPLLMLRKEASGWVMGGGNHDYGLIGNDSGDIIEVADTCWVMIELIVTMNFLSMAPA